MKSDWNSEDRLTLTINALGQKIAANVEIGRTSVRATVKLPVTLAMMAGSIGEFVNTSAEKMLRKTA